MSFTGLIASKLAPTLDLMSQLGSLKIKCGSELAPKAAFRRCYRRLRFQRRKYDPKSMSPALRIACTRLCTLSLRKIAETCALTVVSAISRV